MSNDATMPPDSDDELAELVDRFLREMQAGGEPDPEQWIARHPRLAEPLAECLQGLGAMMQLDREIEDLTGGSPNELPREFGDFELLSELGRGGMGVVYRARQRSLDRFVALKLLRAGRHQTNLERQRFAVEVQAAARLQHPGIVAIYQVGEEQGEPFFAMELVDGISLDQLLEQGPLPARQAAQLARQLARAMEHAHSQDVLHRDLKPSNVLLDSSASSSQDSCPDLNWQPKLTDFGLAKIQTQDSGLTETGQVMGTPSYMSPEQAEGRGDAVSAATDIHALGAILYEVLTGRPPFLAASVIETLAQVREQKPVSPAELNRTIPEDLVTICMKCLEKDPRQRYTTVGELAADLEAFLDNRPIRARVDSWLSLAFRQLRRDVHPEVLGRRRRSAQVKSFAALAVCIAVTGLRLANVPDLLVLGLLLLSGVGLVAWQAPRANDTLVERQTSSVWTAFVVGCLMTAVVSWLMGLEPFALAPLIAILAGGTLFALGSVLSGWFYWGAAGCWLAAPLMALAGPFDFLILGAALFIGLLIPGWAGGRE